MSTNKSNPSKDQPIDAKEEDLKARHRQIVLLTE
jgi:hypothetical protein